MTYLNSAEYYVIVLAVFWTAVAILVLVAGYRYSKTKRRP